MAIPIAILGGLIGLGGAEFRLPLLVGPLRYSPRQAVPLNLAVSIITIAAALIVRSRTLSLVPAAPSTPAILALITGAVIAATEGIGVLGSWGDRENERARPIPYHRERSEQSPYLPITTSAASNHHEQSE